MLTPDQIRAARALLRWSARELAARSSVHLTTIQRMEGQHGVLRGRIVTLQKVQAALEAAGVEFTKPKRGGSGVRLAHRPIYGRSSASSSAPSRDLWAVLEMGGDKHRTGRDALAGVVYGLTMRCELWWQHEANPFEVAPRLVESINSRDGDIAPSAKPPELAARVSLYG